MALYADKSALKAAVLDEILRPDLDYDDLVARAEAVINPKLIRVREIENEGEKFALASDSDSNWLLANAPHIYFDAVVVEGYLKERNTEQATLWQERLVSAIDDLTYETTRDTSARLTVDSDLFRLSQIGWRNSTNLSDSLSGGSSGSGDDDSGGVLD